MKKTILVIITLLLQITIAGLSLGAIITYSMFVILSASITIVALLILDYLKDKEHKEKYNAIVRFSDDNAKKAMEYKARMSDLHSELAMSENSLLIMSNKNDKLYKRVKDLENSRKELDELKTPVDEGEKGVVDEEIENQKPKRNNRNKKQ